MIACIHCGKDTGGYYCCDNCCHLYAGCKECWSKAYNGLNEEAKDQKILEAHKRWGIKNEKA